MEGGAVGHNFEMGLPKDYPSQNWFNLVQRFQRRRFKCDFFYRIFLLVHCCFIFNQMNSNFHCSYMTMSSLTYILGFSVRFFQAVYSV
jgi:hypothetical protein